MKTGYKVCDAMTEKPIMLSSDATLMECARVMQEQSVGAILIGKNKNLQGIVTEQDIVRKAVAANKSPSKVKLSEIMETTISNISPERDIFEALIGMRDLNIRHLPVMDGTKLVGLLTVKDILKIEPQLFDLLVEKFELREEERKPINVITKTEGFCQICGDYTKKLIDNDSVLQCKPCYSSSL